MFSSHVELPEGKRRGSDRGFSSLQPERHTDLVKGVQYVKMYMYIFIHKYIHTYMCVCVLDTTFLCNV